jgi:hypothetical protein
MWVVNDEFLRGIADGDDHCITTVTVPRNQPFFDVELISNVGLAISDPGEFMARFKRLRRPFNEGNPSHLLVNCGDLTTGEAEHPHDEHLWTSLFDRIRTLVPEILMVPGNKDLSQNDDGTHFYSRFGKSLLKNTPSPQWPVDLPLAAVTRVRAADEPDRSQALAYVVLLGFDSNEVAYRNPHIEDHGQISAAQLDATRRLVRVLATNLAINTPLYVIGVTHHQLSPTQDRVFTESVDRDQLTAREDHLECQLSCGAGEVSTLCAANHLVARNTSGAVANASGFLEHCRKIRMSMLFHADMHKREVVTLSTTSLASGEGPAEISVVACPSFDRDSRVSGMTRVRINVWKGEAEVAFSYDADSDGFHEQPIQIVRPLISASRVTASERRLYEMVRQLLIRAAAATDAPEGVPGLTEFQTYFDQNWAETGYVALCGPDGMLPDLPPTRRAKYYLMLLLRERASGGYDILLSHHTPLRPSQFGDWNTLLLPAFNSVQRLLEHLRDDVLRLIVDQAQDLEKATQVRAFEEAIGRVLNDAGPSGEDIWADQLREVATMTKRKISPTTGCVTEYEYHLVTVLPFIRRPDFADRARDMASIAHEPGPSKHARHNYDAIMDWFNELPSVRRPTHRTRGSRVVPIEALQASGSGLRWDPAIDLADESAGRATRASRVPPGAIWFPLPDDDDDPSGPPWRMCPSIVSRNSDVMQWIDRELAARRRPSAGSFPAEIVMGRLATRPRTIEIVGAQFPFTVPTDQEQASSSHPARSMVEAIAGVQFMAGFGLDGQHPYKGLEPVRVLLVRRQIPVWNGARSVILVFDANSHNQDSVLQASPEDALGVLRPVQRYVLQAGLIRAREIHQQVSSEILDPWGFVRIRKDDAPQPVALTPPILEQLHPDDWEDERGEREFILCDGNHRVIELVWNSEHALPAVAVIGIPAEPYYARPFSRLEWSYTAENVRDEAPDQASKYAVRKVDISALNQAARVALAGRDPSLYYRRYFRDLSTGFGYMGGQGGRYV